ncbi:MAG: 50S ribosomal protein L37ae [Candidatus Aenigmarchaeota archaeon]|nr:50S ribosomal protein L37ae [Candidatus Aenigmarchaeota archaeon]
MVTKKVGSTGRFGPRYGRKGKKVVASLEKLQKKKQLCPYCERAVLKRVASGIWECKKCKVKFAGGAYFPSSAPGQAAAKIFQK